MFIISIIFSFGMWKLYYWKATSLAYLLDYNLVVDFFLHTTSLALSFIPPLHKVTWCFFPQVLKSALLRTASEQKEQTHDFGKRVMILLPFLIIFSRNRFPVSIANSLHIFRTFKSSLVRRNSGLMFPLHKSNCMTTTCHVRFLFVLWQSYFDLDVFTKWYFEKFVSGCPLKYFMDNRCWGGFYAFVHFSETKEKTHLV